MNENIALEQINAVNKQTLAEALGIEITKIKVGYVEGIMPVSQHTVQPYQHLHGGASAAFAETLGSMGAFFTVQDEAKLIWGASIYVSHIKSVPIGTKVIGKAQLIHKGNSSQIWDIHVLSQENELVSKSQLTVIVKNKK